MILGERLGLRSLARSPSPGGAPLRTLCGGHYLRERGLVRGVVRCVQARWSTRCGATRRATWWTSRTRRRRPPSSPSRRWTGEATALCSRPTPPCASTRARTKCPSRAATWCVTLRDPRLPLAAVAQRAPLLTRVLSSQRVVVLPGAARADQPGRRGAAVWRGFAAPVRDVHGAAAGHQGGERAGAQARSRPRFSAKLLTARGCVFPLQTQVWSTRGVEGVHRFLARVWRAFEAGISDEAPTPEQLRTLHACIKKASAPHHPSCRRSAARATQASRAPRLSTCHPSFAPARCGVAGDGGDGGAALQHGHLGHDGVRQRRVQVAQPPARRARALRAAALALRAARRRGALVAPRAQHLAGVRPVARGRRVPAGAGECGGARRARGCAGA